MAYILSSQSEASRSPFFVSVLTFCCKALKSSSMVLINFIKSCLVSSKYKYQISIIVQVCLSFRSYVCPFVNTCILIFVTFYNFITLIYSESYQHGAELGKAKPRQLHVFGPTARTGVGTFFKFVRTQQYIRLESSILRSIFYVYGFLKSLCGQVPTSVYVPIPLSILIKPLLLMINFKKSYFLLSNIIKSCLVSNLNKFQNKELKYFG